MVIMSVGEPDLVELGMEVAARAKERGSRIEALIETLTPPRVESEVVVVQARRNAEARARLADEFGLLSSAEVAELSGSTARNRAAIANRWKKEGRLFAVPIGRAPRFPGFQLDRHGRPRPAIATIIGTLRGYDGWQLALWFTASNGWLDGRRPVDLLEQDLDAVIAAASSTLASDRAS